jgi:Sec-independent protein secretion pathway component TatC
MLPTISIYLTSILGAFLTFVVSTKYKQGPVRASALLTLIVAGFCFLFPELFSEDITKQIPLVFFGASFVGMTSEKLTRNYTSIIFAGIIFGFIYTVSPTFFDGYGGALGTAACISILVTIGLNNLIRHSKVLKKKKILLKKISKPSS